MHRPHLRALGEAVAILGISLLVGFLYSHLPLTMDSFAFYSNLARWYYPLNNLDPLTKALDLALFPDFILSMPSSAPGFVIGIWDSIPFMDTYHPLRSYAYIGSLPSLVYFPFFLVWPSPHSVRFFGLIALAIQAVLICKMVRYDTLKCFLILLAFMPYAFQHIVDTGPTALPLVLIYLIVYMMGKWAGGLRDGRARGLLHPLAIGGLVFAGIWCKVSFAFCLPALALCVLHHAIEQRPCMAIPAVRRRFLLQCGIMLVAAGVLTGALLNATGRPPGGKRYYQCFSTVMRVGIEEGNYTYSLARQCAFLSGALLNPLQSAHKIYRVAQTATPSGCLLWGALIALLAYGTVKLRALRRGTRFVLVNVTAFVLVLAAIVSFPAAGSMHHLILAYPFLALAIFSVLSKLRGDRVVAALLAIFVALNLWQYHGLSGMDYRAWDRSQGAGHALVPNFECLKETLDRHSDRYAFVHADWGTYDIKALYGNRDQCNVAVWPLDSLEAVRKVRAICRQARRRPMFIRMAENSSTDLEFLMRHFPGLVPLRLECDAGSWGIWYQPSRRSRRYTHRG